MEEQTSRFIIIPSNTPTVDRNKPNKTSHFKIQLEKPLEIDVNKWEIALLEINYPHSWGEVINAKDCIYYIGTTKTTYDYRKENFSEYRMMLDKTTWIDCNKITIDKYYSIKDMIRFLNEAKPNVFKGEFSLGIKDGKVHLYLNEYEVIKMNQHLSDLLGFEWTKYSYLDGTRMHEGQDNYDDYYMIVAERKPDKRAGMYNMFIYCNLVNEMLVGNKMVKLLRTVAVDPKLAGEYVTQVFHPLRYMKLSSSFFQEIEILITDDLGELVKFLWGKCIIHLHLRKI